MGISINGYIEVRDAFMIEIGREARWLGVVHLDHLLSTRDYLMYHSLFGVRDDTDFTPIAPERGIPIDASHAVLEALEIEFDEQDGSLEEELEQIWGSWILFQELRAIDWEEIATTGTAWEYKNGEPTGGGLHFPVGSERRTKGADFEEDGSIWKFECITRRESLGTSGPLLYDLMEVLAKYHGAEHVRAVVWFD